MTPSGAPTNARYLPNDDASPAIIEGIESTVSVASIVLVACAVVLIGITYFKQRIKTRGSDGASSGMIFKFFANVGDFWTDAAFTIVLGYQMPELFYFSLIFTIFPFLISFVTCMIYLEKWRRDRVWKHIDNYFSKYDVLIMFLSVIAGFYGALALAQSKIWYLNMFHLQMKKSELNEMRTVQFVNIVLLEVYLLWC